MSTRNTVTVFCDGADLPEGGDPLRDLISCRETFSHDGIQSNPEVRKAARKQGWKTGGFDYCPRHKEIYK